MPSTSWPVAALLRSASGRADGMGAPSGPIVGGDGETSGPSEARSPTGTEGEAGEAVGEVEQPASTRASRRARIGGIERRTGRSPGRCWGGVSDSGRIPAIIRHTTLTGREEGQGDDLGRDPGGADDVARHRPEAAPGQPGPR